jgi:hypothetical protein
MSEQDTGFETRRIQRTDRPASTPLVDTLAEYDNELNSEYDFISNPYKKWRAKRSQVQRDLSESKPDYSQEELNKVYGLMNLDESNNPGDFNRDDTILGSASRAVEQSVNVMGGIADVAQMKYKRATGDIEGVMAEQKEIDNANMENSIIQNFQNQSTYGQNVVSQFLFDVTAVVPQLGPQLLLSAGVAAVATPALAALSVPTVLASLLAGGVSIALVEMGFSYLDVVSDPEVRKKMEEALGEGEKLNDATEKEIQIKVQELLMDEADTSAAKVGIASFMNPVNWFPVPGKFSALMKAGSGKVATAGRAARNAAAREALQESSASVISQEFSNEAKTKAMESAGVNDIPEYETSISGAIYEGLVGGTVGMFGGFGRGIKTYSDYSSGKANIIEDGYNKGKLDYKKPGDLDFIPKGPLQFTTRRVVDKKDPATFVAWRKNITDPREANIIDEELSLLRSGDSLMGEFNSKEKLAERKETASIYQEALDNYVTPEETTGDATEEGSIGSTIKDREVKVIYEMISNNPEAERTQIENINLEVINANPDLSLKEINNIVNKINSDRNKTSGTSNDTVETVDETETIRSESASKKSYVNVVVHKSSGALVKSILNIPEGQRNKRAQRLLVLAQENPELTYGEIDKQIKIEEKQERDYLETPPVKAKPRVKKTPINAEAELATENEIEQVATEGKEVITVYLPNGKPIEVEVFARSEAGTVKIIDPDTGKQVLLGGKYDTTDPKDNNFILETANWGEGSQTVSSLSDEQINEGIEQQDRRIKAAQEEKQPSTIPSYIRNRNALILEKKRRAGTSVNTEASQTPTSTANVSEGILNKEKSVSDIQRVLKQYSEGKGAEYKTKEVRGMILQDIAKLAKDKKLKDNGEGRDIRKKPGKKESEYDIDSQTRAGIVARISKKLNLTPPVVESVAEPTTFTGSDTAINIPVEEVIIDPSIYRENPNLKHYDKNNNELPQTIDDENVSQFINQTVLIERPNSSGKLTYTIKEGGPDAQTKIDRVKAGLQPGTGFKARPETSLSLIKFAGIIDGKIIFYDHYAPREQDLTTPNILVPKKEINQGTAENALRHLQTGQPKSYINVKEGKGKTNQASSSFETVTNIIERQESKDSTEILALEKTRSVVERKYDTLNEKIKKQEEVEKQVDSKSPDFFKKERDALQAEKKALAKKRPKAKAEKDSRLERIAVISKSLNELDKSKKKKIASHKKAIGANPIEKKKLKKLNQEIIKLSDKINSLKVTALPSQGETTVRQGVAPVGDRLPINDQGKSQRTVNKKIKNIKEAYKKNNNKYPNDFVEETLDSIEKTWPERINFQRDSVAVEDTAINVSLDMDINEDELISVLYSNGYDLIRMAHDFKSGTKNITIDINEPVSTNNIQFTEPLIDPNTGEDVQARAREESKEYSEGLADSITRNNSPANELEPQLGMVAESNRLQAKLEEKRNEPLTVIEDDVLAPQMREAAAKALSKLSTGLNKGMFSKKNKNLNKIQNTSKAIDQLRSKLPEEGRGFSDEELSYHLWSNEGKAGFPVIKRIGGEAGVDVDNMGIDNYEGSIKNSESATKEVVTAVWTPSWNIHAGHYVALAEKISKPSGRKLKPQAATAKPRKESVPVSTPVTTDNAEPSETVQPSIVASPKITIEELTARKEDQAEDNLGTILLPGDTKGKWTAIITSPGKNYYQDVSAWDGSKYKSSKDFTEQIAKDLGYTKAPKSLVNLIRNRMRDWLIGRVQTEQDMDSLRADMEEKFWPILTKGDRIEINAALTRKGSEPLDLIPKKKSKIVDTDTTESTPTEQAPIQQGFLSENALSAESLTPTKKPSPPNVWLIHPNEVEDIFDQQATGLESPGITNFIDTFMGEELRLGFEVVHKVKGNIWYILPVSEDYRVVDGEVNKIEVPAVIKRILGRKGKDNFGKNKPRGQLSRKLESSELKDDSSSEVYTNLFRSKDILKELTKAHDEKRVKYAHLDIRNKNSVEVFWLDSNLKVSKEKEFKGFVTFKSEELAQQFIEDIKSNNPDFSRIENEHNNEIINRLGASILEDSVDSESINQNNTASIELMLDPLAKDTDPNLREEVFSLGTPSTESSVESTVMGSTPGWDANAELETRQSNEAIERRRLRNRRIEEGGIDHTQPSLRLEEVQGVVDEFANKFPSIPNIEVVDTYIDLPDGKGESDVYGMFEDGKIYIVRSSHTNTDEVLKTLWHEGIGHLGLESSLGEVNFNKLVDLIQKTLPDEIYNSYLDNVGEGTSVERSRQAAKEYLAYQADNLYKDAPPTLWDKVSTWFREVMFDLGVNITWSERDIKMLLLRSADKLRTGAPIRTIENIGTINKRSIKQQDESFNRSDLPESARESWNKIYTTDTEFAKDSSWWHGIRRSLVSSIVDPFRNISEDIGMTEYMVTRLAKRSDGVLATILRHSGVKVEKRNVNGVVVNETILDKNTKSVFETLKPLGTETERKQFMAWMAFNRADKLRGVGKENWYTDANIDAGLRYNEGKMKDATTGAMIPRAAIYENVRKDLMDMNSAVIKLGIDMGLLDKTVAENFEQEFYVPFYRIIEEDIGNAKQGGPVDYNALTGQKGVKRLKGSDKAMSDPFNNLLHNWLHIIDASIKNDAANTTIRSALKITDPMDSSQMMVSPTDSASARSLRVLEDGKEKLYNINNKLLYQSLASLGAETKFPGFKYLISAKGLLTQIVTANPIFKINNIVRDTVSAAGTSDIGYNLIKNAYAGYTTLKNKEADMLVSGGYIQFAYTRSEDPNYGETILNKELSTGYIINNPETDETFLSSLKKAKSLGMGLWDSYAKVGDKLENANRATLFKSLMEGGKSQTEAAFEARDLMDFTLHGGSDWVRLVTSLTPFANSLLQGKYKIGRAVLNNPKPVAVVSSMVLLASIFEEMLYQDDEEYQNRPDYDKDTYWWIKIPGTEVVYKMPKPHEFSIVGNIAWRALKLAEAENPDYGKALSTGVKTLVSREFGIVPVPQAIKPLIELGMNKNLYFDRDIEPLGSQGRSPSLRYGKYTSETLILASQILENSPIDKLKLSPYQLEHLINGYFGWAGSSILGVADMLTTSVGEFPERPARKLLDHPAARRIFKSSPLRNTKSGTVFYERLKELEQTVQDMNFAKKIGNTEKFNEIYDNKKELLKYKAFLKKKQRSINDINSRITDVRNDMDMGADVKGAKMDRLYQLRNMFINKAVKSKAFR